MSDLTVAMNEHHCEAVVVTCMDFRFQALLNHWINKHLPRHSYDRVSLAGADFDMYYVLHQIDTSVSLHHIFKVILVSHEDCGAYGPAGTRERLCGDLVILKEKIIKLWPELQVETLLAHKDGVIEEV